MKISDVISELEKVAPKELQESYDNSGLLVGDRDDDLTNVLISLDCTEEIVKEAIEKQCNLIISHHPILFTGIKKLTGSNYVEKTILLAIKNNIALYAIHTNLDNVLENGVNSKIAEKLKLINRKILLPKNEMLAKLITYVPKASADLVREALFNAGAGNIGNYKNCSFNIAGTGTFMAKEIAQPYVGSIGVNHTEDEIRIEVMFPLYLKNPILKQLFESHPYEEVAYDIVTLENQNQMVGSGQIGELDQEIDTLVFLEMLKSNMDLKVIKHTHFTNKIKKVAVCGGSGSFLLKQAISQKADVFITSDFKYHEFFDAEGKILICDIGHFESEQFTSELIIEIIQNKFPNFAPILAKTNTNPVTYYY